MTERKSRGVSQLPKVNHHTFQSNDLRLCRPSLLLQDHGIPWHLGIFNFKTACYANLWKDHVLDVSQHRYLYWLSHEVSMSMDRICLESRHRSYLYHSSVVRCAQWHFAMYFFGTFVPAAFQTLALIVM